MTLPTSEAFEALAREFALAAGPERGVWEISEAEERTIATACRIAVRALDRNRISSLVDEMIQTDNDPVDIADAIISYLTRTDQPTERL